jgi:hypothetical protein
MRRDLLRYPKKKAKKSCFYEILALLRLFPKFLSVYAAL